MEAPEIIERLNELLAAERSGVHVANRLAEDAGEERRLYGLLKDLARDEAWCCAGLFGAVLELEGKPGRERNGFADKVLALETMEERLVLLNRGQEWVSKRVAELLELETLAAKTRTFLHEMRLLHQQNLAKFEAASQSL